MKNNPKSYKKDSTTKKGHGYYRFIVDSECFLSSIPLGRGRASTHASPRKTEDKKHERQSISKCKGVDSQNKPPLHNKENEQITIDKKLPNILHQLTKVLRAKIGDQVALIPANYKSIENTEYIFKISSIDKKEVTLSLQKQTLIHDPLNMDLGIVFALPNKPFKLEEVLQHCTELGVTEFILFNGDRSNYSHRLAMERLDKIIREAVEQSERWTAKIPSITVYKNLDQYLENKKRTTFVALERDMTAKNLIDMDTNIACDLLIGPEGGFSDREVELMKSYKIQRYTLGTYILRNQTAAIVSAGIVSLKMQK